MNIEQNLILIKGKDKTEEIDYCRVEHGKWAVKFKNSDKEYLYGYYNLEWLKNPRIMNCSSSIVYENHIAITGIINILDFGNYVKLFFKSGFKKIYNRSRIIIEETSLSNKTINNTFEYLKTIANHVNMTLDDDKGFLRAQYNNLPFISPRSVLSFYLKGELPNGQNEMNHLIFPFGFNISQKTATEKAFKNRISVIEGPPGTGKTQTILNIIANTVIQNKTVAVVSNNNSATANILEKLEKYNVEFIAAYLGNLENRNKFFSEQKKTYPSMTKWNIQEQTYLSMKNSLEASHYKLNEMLKKQNQRAILKNQYSALQTEFSYFKQYLQESNFTPFTLRSFSKFTADKVMKILLEYREHKRKGKISLKEKIYNLFFRGIYDRKFYKYSSERITSYLQKLYYEKKLSEISAQISTLSDQLESFNFDLAMNEYTEKSMDLFRAKLVNRYGNEERRSLFTSDAIWKEKEFGLFIKKYPVVLSTTYSLRNSAPKNYLFDYVIIDEASQVDIVTGALAFSCAKNAVIVGDIKQLPNVVDDETALKAKRIFEASGLDQAYNYAEQSLLSSVLNLYKSLPKTLLKEHYRCHPSIIGFCNQKFYNNELIVLTNEQSDHKPMILYKTAKGNHARGTVNQRQIDVVFKEIIPGQQLDDTQQSIGIISPFRLHVNELQRVIGSRKIDADTVHKFQGREKDVIILTTVANEIRVDDFADNPNLINVAVSRAAKQLIVVVSEGSEVWKGTNIGDLVRYIQYNNFEMIESQIYSVFDVLYSSYSDKLLDMLKNSKKVSHYKSENLMNAVIKKVLHSPEFQSIDCVMHQPLRMLIKDTEKLNLEEREYANNLLTHTDFLIYNRLDKQPILVVEVDGHSFHAANAAQRHRDHLKDEILRKYGIPFIRMKTTGSEEEQRLRKKLEEVFKG